MSGEQPIKLNASREAAIKNLESRLRILVDCTDPMVGAMADAGIGLLAILETPPIAHAITARKSRPLTKQQIAQEYPSPYAPYPHPAPGYNDEGAAEKLAWQKHRIQQRLTAAGQEQLIDENPGSDADRVTRLFFKRRPTTMLRTLNDFQTYKH